jgi:hypothetical protein
MNGENKKTRDREKLVHEKPFLRKSRDAINLKISAAINFNNLSTFFTAFQRLSLIIFNWPPQNEGKTLKITSVYDVKEGRGQ